MLTDSQLRSFKPQDKPYKVTVGHGLYVTVTPAGSKSFRYDYRLNGKRETLTIGRYKDGTPSRPHDELVAMDFGLVVSLADARALHDRATRMVQAGFSPSKAKVEKRLQKEEVDTFGGWASRYLEFKADPTLIRKFEIEIRRDEKVMRFLTTVLDKHAIVYAERRRKGEFNKKAEAKEEQA